ncbi:MAG: DUF1553 domain-containing protein [Rubripirellula sp.]|nr:DUF1553 domain-containing protein [Rubripirellula sp.]
MPHPLLLRSILFVILGCFAFGSPGVLLANEVQTEVASEETITTSETTSTAPSTSRSAPDRLTFAADSQAEPSASSQTGTPARLISFELDIQPVLSAYGCNSGPCHGKQRGQNGFQLSLLGFDSDFDHASLSQDARGRRLFPSSPAQSLLLRKAVGSDPHGGGKRFEPDSDAYRTLYQWINQGANRRVDGEAQLTKVELVKSDFLLTTKASTSLKTIATYSDGTTRDVTQLTTYLSNDDAIASIDVSGQVTAGEIPGETSVMARYMNHICVANIMIPRDTPLATEIFDSLPRQNYVDELIYEKLSTQHIEPSPEITAHVFLRRVHQDLIGRLPSAQEARAYLDSTDPDKKTQLVDSLLQRREYADHWSGYWADLLRPNPYRVGIKAVLNYDNWIRQQFRDNVPYDQFVRQLVTAKGSTWQNGAATMFRDRRSPDEITTIVSQLFLGIRLECAKCHHHPFESYSQENFYEFASYFAKVGRKGTGLSPPISGGEEIVMTVDSGEVKHPISGETLAPSPLYPAAHAEDELDPRETFANWLTSTENDYFAKVQVNRLWSTLMGRGLVEPVDDLRSTNPATNPKLLDALAKDFQGSGYDQKHILKTIALSRAYAHQSVPTPSNASDRVNYSRHYRHRVRAEVLLDAIADFTETSPNMNAMPPESRANQVWTTRVSSVFLDTFGRPNENQDPPCERTPDSTMTQSLHLMNSRELDSRIKSSEGRATRLAKSQASTQEVVEELYLAAFSRFPSDEERKFAIDLIDQNESKQTGIEDLMWAMINAPEFSIQD